MGRVCFSVNQQEQIGVPENPSIHGGAISIEMEWWNTKH